MNKYTKIVSCRISKKDYLLLKENNGSARKAIEFYNKEFYKTTPAGLLIEKKEIEEKIKEKKEKINNLKKELNDFKIKLKSINEALNNETQNNINENNECIKKQLGKLKELFYRNQLQRGKNYKIWDMPPQLFKNMAERCGLPLPEFKKAIKKEFE
jgi:uncharacterized protein YoxC